PKEIDGKRTEGSWRSHQVPLTSARDTDEHLADLDAWLRSYRPEELFDETGALRGEIAAAAPEGALRMSANPSTNGGSVLTPLRLPDFRDYAIDVPLPGGTIADATKVLRTWLRDVVRDNPENFRIFGPTRPHRTVCRPSTRRPTSSGTPSWRSTTAPSTWPVPGG